jgi:hypothetical protein
VILPCVFELCVGSGGFYLVNITASDKRYTRRLVIQP